MNASDLKYLLSQPRAIESAHSSELKLVLKDFPYFQAARALFLKSLFSQNNFKYNSELKRTAAYTTDRSVLFNYITSRDFKSIVSADANKKDLIENIVVKEYNIVGKTSNQEITVATSLEESIIKSIIQADKSTLNTTEHITLDTIELNTTSENIISKDDINNFGIQNNNEVVQFNPKESHSFTKWLQLTKMQPIDRSNTPENASMNKEVLKSNDSVKENKFKLIDQFIAKNPKIIAIKEATTSSINIEKSTEEKSYLMTETLAKIYLEQKKYTKAIQAYEILILKYPEKSSLFAERIKEIKKLQNNNN